jgi:hypothetical protein
MKFRIPLVCGLGLAAAVLALPSYARGIGVDETLTCSKTVPPTLSLWVANLAGTGFFNNADPGVNFPALVCDDSALLAIQATGPYSDGAISFLPFDPTATSTVLYTWVDLSVVGGTPSSNLLVAPGQTGTPLSNFSNPNPIPIVAQVAVVKLTGSYAGDYEVIFNYQPAPASTCSNAFAPISPALTWGGAAYLWSGGSGTTPCDPNSTNDFLFGSKGQLLGYFDSSNALHAASPPPGWCIVGGRSAYRCK